MKQFLNGISYQLKNIICPSDYVKSIVISAYPEYKSRIIQRPHLKFEGHLERKSIQNQIKIDMLVSKSQIKGLLIGKI